MHIPEFVVEGDALQVSESYPVIIFSQQFRENEYKESEFLIIIKTLNYCLLATPIIYIGNRLKILLIGL